MTCMTIDENGIGTVLGTGCANIYSAGCNYSLNGTKLLADTIDIKQLLQGCTYNFNTHEATFNTLNRQINTASLEETGNYTVLASGSNSLPDNMAMLNELVTGNGLSSDPVLLLSGNETQANAFKEKLLLFGSSGVDIFMINADAGANPELSQKIDSAVKILFLLNSTTTFNPFLSSQNGEFLKQKVHNSGMITAFVGDDARFAGNTVVENYLTLYASYYGELTFSKGLSLLRHTVIMPNTYQNSDVYENTITAVPYAMALDSLKYGIWLTNHSYMKYTPAEEKAMLTGYGSAPVMVIRNEGSLAGFSSHTSNGNNSTAPRMIAGYEHLQLSLIDYTTPYFMGNIQTAGVQNESGGMTDFIQPNPVKDMLFLHGDFHDFGWEIINMNGKRIMQGKSIGKQEQINVSILRSGIYLLRFTNKKSNSILNAKFIKM